MKKSIGRPPKKARITIRCEERVAREFRYIAQNQGLKQSALLLRMVNQWHENNTMPPVANVQR